MQSTILKEVLQLINQTKIATSEAGGRGQEAGQAHILLMLYEFEAKSLLGMEGLESLLERLAAVPTVEPKTFETVAGVREGRKGGKEGGRKGGNKGGLRVEGKRKGGLRVEGERKEGVRVEGGRKGGLRVEGGRKNRLRVDGERKVRL